MRGSNGSSSSPGIPTRWDAERVVALKIIGRHRRSHPRSVRSRASFRSARSGGSRSSWSSRDRLPLPAPAVLDGQPAEDDPHQLPDVMDLLTISVEAGLGFDAAIAQVVKQRSRLACRGAQSTPAGDPDRCQPRRRVPPSRRPHQRAELQGFVLSMMQADMFGVSHLERASRAVARAAAEAATTGRGDRPEDPGEAPVPDDLPGDAGDVHRDARSRRHEDATTSSSDIRLSPSASSRC